MATGGCRCGRSDGRVAGLDFLRFDPGVFLFISFVFLSSKWLDLHRSCTGVHGGVISAPQRAFGKSGVS